MTLLNAASELPIGAQDVQAGSIEEPAQILIRLAEAMLALQQFTGQLLQLPAEGVSRETLKAVLELADLVERGILDTTWSAATARVDRQAAATLIWMIGEGKPNRLATRTTAGFQREGKDFIVGVLESVVDEALITPENAANIRRQLEGTAEWIEVSLTPASGSARATKRLLPLGADDQPAGGEAWQKP